MMRGRFPGRRFGFEWLLLVIALFCLGGVIGYSLHEEHAQVAARERERLQAQAKVIGDNLGHQITGAERALKTIIGDLKFWRGVAGLDSASPRLKMLDSLVPGVRTLSIVDAQGWVVASTRSELVGRDFSRRDYFTIPRQRPDPAALYVAPPFQAVLGFFALNVSRAVFDADGRFAGVVSATLDPDYFNVLMDSVRYAPDMLSALVHGDGRLFVLVPARPGTEGTDLAVRGSLFTRHMASGKTATLLTGIGAATGGERMMAQLTVRPAGVPMDKPLVVAVSRELHAIYAGWRKEAGEKLGLFAIFALASGLGLHFHQRRQRRLDAVRAARAAERQLASDRLRIATEASGIGVWEYDLQSDELTWDASMFALYGVAAAGSESGYAAWRNCVLPADLPAVEAALQASVRDGGEFRTSFRIRRGDGEIRVIRVLAKTRCDAAGRSARVVGINEDITDRWQADEAIRESEARFRLMADSAPVLIWVSGPEKARGFFNRSWLEFTGRTAAEEDGLGWLDGVHGDDRERVQRTCDDAYVECRAFAMEYRLRRHEGVYRWVLDHGAPRFGASHCFLGFVGSCLDIDTRRHVEADLRKLSRAVEQSATAVVITDASGRIEYVNPAGCAAYGYTEEELVGRNPNVFKSGSTPPDVYRALWQTILAGETWRGELTNRRRDGSLVLEAVTISPVRDDAGQITHFVALKDDVTAERKAESLRQDFAARMVKLERMELLGSLAGGIAHDFNNILVAILGFSGIGKTALRAAGGPPRVVGYFEEIETAGERAKTLVQQLLTFSRGGRMAVELVQVADVVREVLSLLKVTFPAAVGFVAEVDEDLPLLTVDPSHLHQLLVNLCVNARDAMNGPGKVVVSARLVRVEEKLVCDSCHCEFSGEFFRIAVGDDGPGIADDIRDRVFEPFFTTKEVGRGTGMGLAVVHGVSHLYDGHVQLLSEAGKGTELAIYLPREPSYSSVVITAEV